MVICLIFGWINATANYRNVFHFKMDVFSFKYSYTWQFVNVMVNVFEITLWVDPIKGQRENMTYQFLKN
jgi:hypothetical protein